MPPRFTKNTRRALRKSKRRVPRKGGRGGRVSVPRAMATAGRGQYATITETQDGPDLSTNSMYAAWINLSRFPRASVMASQFQFYRLKSISYTYEPLYNTFVADNSATTYSKPYMFTCMNRIQDNQAVTYAQLISTGARPQAFTSKKVVTYKPNWCSPGLISVSSNGSALNGIVQQGLRTQYGWLASTGQFQTASPQELLYPPVNDSTAAPTAAQISANTVIYNGHVLYIQQESPAAATPVCKQSITCVWEFKGAKI